MATTLQGELDSSPFWQDVRNSLNDDLAESAVEWGIVIRPEAPADGDGADGENPETWATIPNPAAKSITICVPAAFDPDAAEVEEIRRWIFQTACGALG